MFFIQEEGQSMKRKRCEVHWFMFVTVLLVFTASLLPAGEIVTITGMVNDNYQIVVNDEEVYELADTEKGNEVASHVGKKMNVTGLVEEVEGIKRITVESFELIGQ